MTHFYNYLHCTPNGEPFYVGKGKGRRCYEFANRSMRHKEMVAAHGVANIKIWVFPCESEKEAFSTEVQWISQLRGEGFDLANLTNGGEGPSGAKHTEEFKRMISKLHTGKINSDATRAKMSKAKRGVSRPPRTAEHSANVSAAMKGRVCSEETRRKIAETKIGKKRPPEVIAKMLAHRKSQKGVPRDPEIVARIVAARKKNGHPSPLKGRKLPPHSAERKRKLSEAAKAYWAATKLVLYNQEDFQK